jgi:hypothetical protein
MLDPSMWGFKALLPYDSPTTGIRWSAKTSTFDEARAFLSNSPDVAANRARAIMDIELALRAEKLKIKLSYLHRERNDHRVAHDFLVRLIADGETAFQRKEGNDYKTHNQAIEALRNG